MSWWRALTRAGAAAFLIGCGVVAVEYPLAPAQAPHAAPQDEVLRGHELYFAGKPKDAIRAYQGALRRDPTLFEAWLNGAVVWDAIGHPNEAAAWYGRALRLRPDEAVVRAELGELDLRRGHLGEARTELDRALKVRPADPHALIARGRVEMSRGRPRDAVLYLEKAAMSSPSMSLAWYWLGMAQEEAGDLDAAVAAYDRSAADDSYFTAGRERLAGALAKEGRVREALDEVDALLEVDKGNPGYERLKASLSKLHDRGLRRRRLPKPVWTPPPHAPGPSEPVAVTPPTARVPILRVGIGTTALGHPLPWRGLDLSSPKGFSAVDTKRGRRVARADDAGTWTVLAKGRAVELRGPGGAVRARARGPVVVEAGGAGGIELRELPGGHGMERKLRGRVELSAYKGGLKVVNIVDLESYTEGVLSSEMPIDSPMEALKAQAVLARTDALFMKRNGARHRADGYDLCDGQHCQVYRGMRAETRRSRAVVEATRGRIVTYKGRPVDVLYSSDCGGHTQSASEVTGWGNRPYFVGRPDAPQDAGSRWSPWELRRWLETVPPAYCAPSRYVHPSHYRWARVVTAKDLEARLDRTFHLGKLRWVQPLRRARSGHLDSIEVEGARGTRVIDDELRIRSLFGPGSQRSSLFIMDAEYDAHGRPTRYVFYGGGWGHGVGFCQSGAMGRAEKGQDYITILRAYYSGVEIGSLRY
ncbi:MAG: SpoIID/LytB domain-containing protein [Elusimicrobia bacterium]|nr:SpoIID/LytB domain-containing protein [Elusimicrobiota bacterium]